MRKKLRGALLALAPLILANCVGVEPQGRLAHSGKAELLARLQLGQPALDCREPCLSEWRRVQPMAAQLDAATNWDDLAVLVMRSGYQRRSLALLLRESRRRPRVLWRSGQLLPSEHAAIGNIGLLHESQPFVWRRNTAKDCGRASGHGGTASHPAQNAAEAAGDEFSPAGGIAGRRG
jgi:hypothetical protein